ncbi:MAG: OmpA family protein [Flavobacteriales bacterium]|nr:OmpA family protein [Flavobacteriales bacterium]
MRIVLLFFSLLIVASLFGQNDDSSVEFKKGFAKATNFMFDGNFDAALSELMSLKKLDDKNSNINFQIGYCHLQPPIDADNAIRFFNLALKDTTRDYVEGAFQERKAPMEMIKYLADAYHLDYKFDSAIIYYEIFLKELDAEAYVQKNEIKEKIKMCNTAKAMVSSPVNMDIKNLGKIINSKYDDYEAVVNADESILIFTSKRKGTGELIDDQGKYYEDVYISFKDVNDKWTEPKPISSSINTNDHEASIWLSVDGQELIIYKYDLDGQGDLYKSRIIDGEWTVPEKLGSDINTTNWEGHASISTDHEYLYFSSDRPGGYGGKDIYFCKKLPTGEWALAQNAGPDINTAQNEDAPFFHPDGLTLFFSSEGHGSMGGFDVFFSERIEDKTWSTPINIGYPVNSPGDDIYFYPTADGKRAYYSSLHRDGMGDQDIYLVSFPDFEVAPLTVFKGAVKDRRGKVPGDVLITVTDVENGELIGNYSPNSLNGKYVIILTPGKSYNIDYEWKEKIFHSEKVEVPQESAYQEIYRPIELPDLTVGGDDSGTDSKEYGKSTPLFLVGFVKEGPNGKGVPSARVIINDNLSGNEIAKIETPESGKFKQEIQTNVGDYLHYDVKIEKEGYLSTTYDVKHKVEGEGETMNITGESGIDLNKAKIGADIGKLFDVKSIYFDLNSSKIRPDAATELDKIVSAMKNNPGIKIELGSHTDSRGSDEYNLSLSDKRAKSSAAYIISKGVNSERILGKGYGETKLVNKCTNGVKCSAAQHQENRRTEFKIIEIK